MRAFIKLGYKSVKEYRGGKKEWMENRLPTESSPPKILESLKYVFGG